MQCLSLKRPGGLQEGAKGAKKLPECVLEVPSLHEVELNYGTQDLPDFTRPGSAAGEPIMKERALLQVGVQAPILPLSIFLPPIHFHAGRRPSSEDSATPNTQLLECSMEASSSCPFNEDCWRSCATHAMAKV